MKILKHIVIYFNLFILITNLSIKNSEIIEKRTETKSENSKAGTITKTAPLQLPFNYDGTYFTSVIGLGTPAQSVTMLLDAGSCELVVYSSSCTNCIRKGYNPGVFTENKS